LLLSSASLKELNSLNAAAQLETIVQQISTITPFALLDIGVPSLPNFDKICGQLTEIMVLTEPYPRTVIQTRTLLEELAERDFGRSHLVTVVIVNRSRADTQLSMAQVQDKLGHPIALFIPPAPEQAYQAGLRNLPLLEVQANSLVTQQINQLGEALLQRVKK
jgi:Flp pilus assembly CpaE family ATPase